MDDNDILVEIFLPGQVLIANNRFKPILRLIGRIIAHNMCPKSVSFNNYSNELFLSMFAIMDKLQVNWAQVVYGNLIKNHTNFLSHGAFLTKVFYKFKVELSNKTNVVKHFELFDHIVLFRMKLLSEPPPTTHQGSSSH